MRTRLHFALAAAAATAIATLTAGPAAHAAPAVAARPAAAAVIPAGCYSFKYKTFDAFDSSGTLVYSDQVEIDANWTYSTSGASVTLSSVSFTQAATDEYQLDVDRWEVPGGTVYRGPGGLLGSVSWTSGNLWLSTNSARLSVHYYNTRRPSVGASVYVYPCHADGEGY